MTLNVIELLKGKTVNLKTPAKDDLSQVMQWWSNPQYMGEYQDVMALSKPELEKVMFENTIFFIIQKKDGINIGHINGFARGRTMEIGFAIIPPERGKGYGTEAIQLMVDHLFLTKEIARIQASTDTRNLASQRALEKASFAKEGTMRKSWYAKGRYNDHYLYSILREEWNEPRILERSFQKPAKRKH